MYIMYIYNILELNSLNCPVEQFQSLLAEISPKPHDQREYEWTPSYQL